MNRLFPLVLATFASGTQTYVFAGLLTDVAADLGVSIGAAGLIAASFAVTFAIAAPFAALLASRIERRRVLVLALFATAVLNVLAAVAPTFEALVGIRIVVAVASAFINPIASATAVMLVEPERRGRALALVTAGLTVAFTIGIPVGSVIGGLFDWRATFVFAAGLALIAAVAVRVFLPLVPAPAGPAPNFALVLGEGRVLSSFALTFLGFAATFSVVAFLGPVVNAVTGFTGGAVGPFQACIGIGSLIGVLIGGRIADNSNARGALVLLYALMAATLASYSILLARPGAAGSSILLGAVILVGAAVLFALMPVIQTRLAKAAPAAGPLLFGLNGTMIFAGQGAGALIGGLITDFFSFASVGLVGAAIALAAIVVSLLTVRAETEQADDLSTTKPLEQPQ